MGSDYYAVLGLQPDATTEEIKRAYRRLALRYHPDRNRSPDAHDRFIKINEAYLILSDDEARERYDATRASNGHQRSSAAAEAQDRERGKSKSGSSPDGGETWFQDAELSGWAKNARRQAERFASMNYVSFANMIGQVAKETGSQLVNAFVFALSSLLGASAIFTLVSGFSHGEIGQIALGLISGALCVWGLTWSGKKYDL